MTKKSLIDQEAAFFSSVNATATAATLLSGSESTSASTTTASAGSAAPPSLGLEAGKHVQGEVLVKFGAGLPESGRAQGLEKAAMAVGGQVAEIIHGVNSADSSEGTVARVTLGKGVSVEQAIQLLSKFPGVEVAEPNWVYTTQAITNDSSYTNGSLWGMYGDTPDGTLANSFGSQANEAWSAGKTGTMSSVVGVIDTGIDYTHPDLYLNVWLNQGEIPSALRPNLSDVDGDRLITFRDLNASANSESVQDLNGNGRIDAGDLLKDSMWANGISDDGDSYIDDLIGWDFYNNDNDPFDDAGHGTHVSGTIGGMGGNGTGVAGVNWNVQLVGLKFLGANGSGQTSGAVSAVNYFTTAASKAATAENFVATNNSWGGGGFSTPLLNSIVNGANADILFVAAAGNGGSDGRGDNNDTTPNYPANYDTSGATNYDAVISVAAIDSSGRLASFSNYGPTTVDLGAPGVGIVSSVPGGGYSSYSGTSMATPHVTGALALLASTNTSLSALQLKSKLLSTAAATSSLSGTTLTGDRLDIGALINNVVTPPSDTIWGTDKGDSIIGTALAERLAGVPSSGTSSLGKGTIDKLSGLGGADVFLLGDSRGRFYDDGSAGTSGTSDYGYILDFSKTQGDKIQLKSGGNYYLKDVKYPGGISGAGIFYDSNNSGAWDSGDEIIGIVGGIKASTLANTDFIFV